jgi:hypothetical protein
MLYDSGVSTSTESRLRGFILALLTFGLLALAGELVALNHFEDPLQLVPLGVIALTLLVIGWYTFGGGGGAAIRVLQIVFVVMMATGAVGIMLHYQGNAEFQREVDPTIAGWSLFTKVLHAKAPPALAPGVMAQLGLLGLIYTYRHPALRTAADAFRQD